MDKPKEAQSALSTLPKRNRGPVQQKFRKLVIESNRFKVDVSNLSCLCIFAMKFISQKKVANNEERAQILSEILPQIKQFIHDPIVKDGLIFSHKAPKLSDKTITHGDHIVVIREISRFDAQSNSKMLLFFLGNVMRKVMQKLGFIQVGNSRKFIKMDKSIEVENVLIYSGFKAHFELLDNGYYLTVDTTKKIVRNESVLEYINYLYTTYEGRERNQKRELVRKSMIGKTVMTNYGKTRYLKIEDVLFIDLTQVIIESCQMLLPEYYKHRYEYKIKNLKQPLLYANNKKSKFKTYLVPELCLMTGIPEDFDENRNKFVTESARVSADVRKFEIDNFVQTMNEKQGDLIFPVLGVKISSKPQKIEAKLIPPPKILVGQGKTIIKGRESNFTIQDLPIYKQKSPTKLAILALESIDCSTIIDYFSRTFKALKMKIQICVIKTEGLNIGGKRGIDELQGYLEVAKEKERCNFCLVVIENKMRNLYVRIKELVMVEREIGCQVVLESTLKVKNVLSVALKIMIQILAKAGNTIWLSIPEHRKQKLMFTAFYSCQSPKTKPNSLTLGICSTLDDLQSQTFSKTKPYTKQFQQLHTMKQLLLQSLAVYKKRNGYVPNDIVVIENQKSARTEEATIGFFVEPVVKMMEEYYGLKRPRLVYVMIRKSLNNRFFRVFEGKCINPPIGTLINSQVTSNNSYNFYLVSHDICRKGGSITPYNYKVIYSDSTLEEGILQSMLYGQCFSYPNYTGAIKQPGVLQAVTKCARFGAEVLSQVPEGMRMMPYYL